MSSGLYISADRGVMDPVYEYGFSARGYELSTSSGCAGAIIYDGCFSIDGSVTLGRHELGDFADEPQELMYLKCLCRRCAYLQLVGGLFDSSGKRVSLSAEKTQENEGYYDSIARSGLYSLDGMSNDELLALPVEQRTFPVYIAGVFPGTPYRMHYTADLRVDFFTGSSGDYMTQLHLLNVVLEFTLA